MQDEIDAALARVPAAQWSVCVRGADGVLAAHRPDAALSTASVPKILLLAEVARRVAAGDLDPELTLARTGELAVADSGIWQFLGAERLAVRDLAVLVASVSDNLATNVLLDHVGLEAVGRLAAGLGLRTTALHDRVRNGRGPQHPPRLSSGSAGELAALMQRIATGTLLSAAVSAQLARWLAANTDLSMVAAAFGLDPLAHVGPDRGLRLCNKTGTDIGVRADVGVLGGPAGGLSYAVIANWDEPADGGRDEVLGAMRAVGAVLRSAVERG